MTSEACAKCNKPMIKVPRWFRCSSCKAYFCPSCMTRFCLFCKGEVKPEPSS